MAHRERHPEFDLHWARHHRLVWYFARRFSVALGYRPEEVVGTAVLTFNDVLWVHDPAKGRISTILVQRLKKRILAEFFARESEFLRQVYRLACKKRDGARVGLRAALQEAEVVDVDLLDLSVAEARDDLWDAVQVLGGPGDAFWEVLRPLPARQRRIVIEVCDGRTQTSLAAELGVSKERVRQLYDQSLRKLRESLSGDGRLSDWFPKGVWS